MGATIRALARFVLSAIISLTLLKSPQGQLKPILELSEEDKKLNNFDWKISLRPFSKYDIFRREPTENQEEELETTEN